MDRVRRIAVRLIGPCSISIMISTGLILVCLISGKFASLPFASAGDPVEKPSARSLHRDPANGLSNAGRFPVIRAAHLFEAPPLPAASNSSVPLPQLERLPSLNSDPHVVTPDHPLQLSGSDPEIPEMSPSPTMSDAGVERLPAWPATTGPDASADEVDPITLFGGRGVANGTDIERLPSVAEPTPMPATVGSGLRSETGPELIPSEEPVTAADRLSPPSISYGEQSASDGEQSEPTDIPAWQPPPVLAESMKETPSDETPSDETPFQPASLQPPRWRPVEVPFEPEAEQQAGEPSDTAAAQVSRDALRIVANQADAQVRRAIDLASRQATFSARAELVEALRLISQALDARAGNGRHSVALAAGLRALEEADDFAPPGTNLEAEMNLSWLVSGHQTPVLKRENLSQLTALVALQRYYTYAQEQLVVAGGGLAASSRALTALGKFYMHQHGDSSAGGHAGQGQRRGGPKAMALFQAALRVDAANVEAANELGFLLARYGQLPEAQRVLQHAVTVGDIPEAWHNLAIVHHRLGQTDLARRAEAELQRRQRPQLPAPQSSSRNVRWVNTDEFDQASPPIGSAP